MSVVEQIAESLDTASQQIWDDGLDDSAFDILRRKALWLSAQIAVHEVLQNTARHLLGPQNSSGLLNAQSRLGKFIDTLYGKPDNEKNEARWQKLRDMDCAGFLFIAVSYTPLEITKMHRIEFDYLVGNASKFLQLKALPPKWVFRKEIQIAIAGKADLEGAASFRRSSYSSLRSKKTSNTARILRSRVQPRYFGKRTASKTESFRCAKPINNTNNIDSNQSINRRTVPNRMISRTFQQPKTKRSMIVKVQRAQQVTNIELRFDLCLWSNLSRINRKPNDLATYRDRCRSYSCIYQGRSRSWRE